MPISFINCDVLLRKALYWGDDYDDILNIYEKKLRQIGTVEATNHANAVKAYHTACNNKTLLKTLRGHFKELDKLIGNTNNVLIYGRRKSFISYESKIRNYIKSEKNLVAKDLFAFRIISLENNSILAINHLYKMAEQVIDFFTNEGLIVCDLTTPIEDFNASDFPNIIVPRKSMLKDEYKKYVKDYIYHPKANGYQSLHLLFQTPNGVFFEIQLRTLAQHVWDEEEAGSWKQYKKNKYKYAPKFNPKKIMIPGFVTSSNGTVFDTTGLIKSKEILRRSL